MADGAVVDGEIVFQPEEQEQGMVGGVEQGDFADAKIETDAFNLGKSAAELVYTKEGRAKAEALLEKIRNKLKIRPESYVHNLQVLTNLNGIPLANFDPKDEPTRQLLNRAVQFSRYGYTDVPGDEPLIGIGRIMQKRGFENGFESVVDKSPFKDDEKPWYLKSEKVSFEPPKPARKI